METPDLIRDLKAMVDEIPEIKQVKEGFHNPHVKAWKTRLEDLLRDGGTTCSKALDTLKKMKMNLSGSAFIKNQTYINQLDALNRTLKQTIQTIEVFGRPEEKNQLPKWGKPKSQQKAVGHLMVGEEEVATDEITIHEVIACLVSLAEDSNDLSSEMRDILIKPLNDILGDDLLEPFLNRKLDTLLGHWPEFQTK